jgi:hypothetical protein
MRIYPLSTLLLWMSAAAVAPALGEQRCDTSRYPLSTPTERFTDNGDGTVTDKSSGLMWMRCALGQQWTGNSCAGEATLFASPEAQAAADAVNRSGDQFFSDWRVPGLRDLALIAERECENPRINLAVFPNTAAAFFWTSTERQDDPEGRVYALSFGSEGVEAHARSLEHQVRLVRSAQ